MNVGHGHPHVMEAVQAQLDKCHAHLLSGRDVRVVPRAWPSACARWPPATVAKKAIFFSTGAEAVENAVKIARAHTGRPAIISFQGGFHGRTLLALSLTGWSSPTSRTSGPIAPEVYQAPFPYEYRGWSTEKALAALDELFGSAVCARSAWRRSSSSRSSAKAASSPRRAAFLRELRALTERHGILLIADEIQSGFGRTGKFFAIEHSGVTPDLMTVAKSLAAGFPLSGVIGRADVMDAPGPGGLGGTYGGNPVACAAGLAVLDVMRDERLPERAARIGSVIEERMRSWAAEHEIVGDVRVLGAMAGMELVRDRQDESPGRHRDRAAPGAGSRTRPDPAPRRRPPQRHPDPDAADHS